MKNTKLGILTDAAPSANSSTSREVADLIYECNARDLDVSVYHPKLSVNDSYNGTYNKIVCKSYFYKEKRLYLRFISEIHMSISLSFLILLNLRKQGKIDLVLWISPSIFNLLPAYILKKRKRAKIYLMLRDLFPYWATNIGIISRKSVVFKLFKIIADWQMCIADRIGVESIGSLEIFQELYPQHSSKTEILRNWITVKNGAMVNKKSFTDKVIRLIYSGNIGPAQGINHFTALLSFLKDKNDIEVHFVGRGSAFLELIRFIKSEKINNFYLHDLIPFSNFDNFLNNFDIGLVFLDFKIRTSNIPGKAMSYLMNGLPILGAINPENELEKFVHENKLGSLDTSGDINNFISKVDCMIANYRLGKYQAKEIKNRSELYFSTSKACDQIFNFSGIKNEANLEQ